MSLAELEEAVEELSLEEYSHFRKWLITNSLKTREYQAWKADIINRTSGCLKGADGAEFEKNVEAAGKGMSDDHSW